MSSEKQILLAEVARMESLLIGHEQDMSHFRDKIREHKKRLEGINSPKGRKPLYGDTYYYLASDGEIFYTICSNREEDHRRVSIGNYHRTNVLAANAREYLGAKEYIEDFVAELNKGWEPEWGSGTDSKIMISYDHHSNTIEYNAYGYTEHVGTIVLRSIVDYDKFVSQVDKSMLSTYWGFEVK